MIAKFSFVPAPTYAHHGRDNHEFVVVLELPSRHAPIVANDLLHSLDLGVGLRPHVRGERQPSLLEFREGPDDCGAESGSGHQSGSVAAACEATVSRTASGGSRGHT